MGNFSIELCGGTHVSRTGDIGLFKIVVESGIAAGIRRIEAITSTKAEEFFNDQLKLVSEIKSLLKNPKDTLKSLSALIDEKNELEKQVQLFYKEKAQAVKKQLVSSVVKKEEIKNILFEMKNEIPALFCVLGAQVKGKPSISVIISDELVKSRNLNAGNIVRELAKEINGGGGGQPFYAQAGGSKPEGLSAAIEKAKGLL